MKFYKRSQAIEQSGANTCCVVCKMLGKLAMMKAVLIKKDPRSIRISAVYESYVLIYSVRCDMKSIKRDM